MRPNYGVFLLFFFLMGMIISFLMNILDTLHQILGRLPA